MSTLRHETVEHVVRAAALAPLLPGVVPPTLVWIDDVLEVRAERSADVRVDRDRCLVAGAALQHVQVAARGLSLEATCEAFPEPSDPGSVARVRLARGRPAIPREVDLAASVVDQYATRPGVVVPLADDVVAVLRLAVETEGAELVVTPDESSLEVHGAIATPDDGPVAWVVAGCALGALLLRASQYGVQVAVEALPLDPGSSERHEHLALGLSQLRLRLTAARRPAAPVPVRLPAAVGH